MRRNLIGPNGRLFGEVQPGPDEVSFQVDNTSIDYFNSPYYLAHQSQVQAIPAPTGTPLQMSLGDIAGTDVTNAITTANKIVFHSVGDTGAAKSTGPATEASVADMMANDLGSPGASFDPGTPAFFFHLGDVVYYFGEGQYYYDQFYEPFRAYDRPIFAVPGNHDGMVFGSAPNVPQIPTLQAFLRNFCAAKPGPSPDAGGLVRSVMNEPAVYFTLDAPFLSIIGLYSNVLEGPGVISSQGGAYPIGDEQLAFLQSELARLKPDSDAGNRVVILALHHPPLSVDRKHGGTTGLSADIDKACQAAGLWPDAVLSGHAHLYQRFTRRVQTRQIPYVVAGSGGFSATRPQGKVPPAPYTIGEVTLEVDPVIDFGYLTLTVNMAAVPKTLTITFRCPSRDVIPTSVTDHVTVDLATHQIVS